MSTTQGFRTSYDTTISRDELAADIREALRDDPSTAIYPGISHLAAFLLGEWALDEAELPRVEQLIERVGRQMPAARGVRS